MALKKNSFLVKWFKDIAKAKKQRKQYKITERCEKEWDKKLRGLK